MSQEVDIKLGDDLKINFLDLHKMAFLFNALENGWTIKKNSEAYIFSKKHEGKKEVFLDTYLRRFIVQNLTLNNRKDK
tara:strand:+ start:234 stop:467 length:234 start_codon:yes stop_codon:yes gene_type:complete